MTEHAVLALAPDAASAKAAQGLLKPTQWPRLGVDDTALWGECQGSGSKPYQTQVDRSGPVFKCSCPSRKFPCKHGLALMLLHVQAPQRFTDTAQPEWVQAWLSGRRERAEKQERKDEAQAEKIAQARAAVEAAREAGDAPVLAVSAETANRQAKRWQRIETGLQDVSRWLTDQMAKGLAARSDSAGVAAWRMLATRMVDAQAPALAAWLQAAADEVESGASGAASLLGRVGRLQLLIDAVQGRERLSLGTQADVRATLGWPLDREEVLVQGETVEDVWTVLGQLTQEREGRLVERRVWLHGARSGRRALLLDFSHGTAGFETAWLTGQSREAQLVFFPSAAPLRAVLAGREPSVSAAPVWEGAGGAWDAEWECAAAALAAHPWLPLWPVYLRAVQVALVDDRLWVCGPQHAVPLQVPKDVVAELLALSGGHPVNLMAEWNGQALRLLNLDSDEGQWQCLAALAESEAPSRLSPSGVAAPSVIESLLSTALVGTERSAGWRAALRALPEPLTPVTTVLAQADESLAAVSVLRAAGAVAVGQRVGGLQTPRDAVWPQGHTAAAAERRPVLSPAQGAALLPQVFEASEALGAQHEALQCLHQRGWRIPAGRLPVLLDLAVQVSALRPAVAAVMGERGRWLVQQVKRWSAIVEVPAEPTLADWEHGPSAVRLAWLQTERRRDPAAARERLVAELPQLGAKERTELVAALAVQLSMQDEPVLERLLRDRAGDVRALAAGLLLRLPESAQVQWLHGQWDGLLQQSSVWLGLRKRWTLDAPTAEHPDWKAHAVQAQRPPHSRLGERAWWLYALARLTPLSMWTTRLALSPAELIAWARETEWFDALLQAWVEVALAAPDTLDSAWVTALLACPESRAWGEAERTQLRAGLPPGPRREDWLQRLRESKPRQGTAGEVAAEVVQLCAQRCEQGEAEPAAVIDPVLGDALVSAMVRDLHALQGAEPYGSPGWRAWDGVVEALVGWLPRACWPGLAVWQPPSAPAHERSWQQDRLCASHARVQQLLALRQVWQDLPRAA